MMVKKILGDIVKEERLRRNLSQNALAEQAHISLRTVSDIENYRGNPQFETLCALASYLDISIDAIIYGRNPSADSSMNQLMIELDQCSGESRQLVLAALRGMLSSLNETS